MILLLSIMYTLLQIYYYVLILYILLSWIPELQETRFYYFLHQVADPFMRLFRGIIVIGQVDLTPIAGFLLYGYGLRIFGQFIQTLG